MKNRKDDAREQEEQIYYILINTSSMTAKPIENVAMAWIDCNHIRYCPNLLDNRLSQLVEDIRRIHKVYRENYEKLKSGIDRRKKFSWVKNPERNLPGRCTITITICNSKDTSQSHTEEMQKRIQIL